MRARTLWDGDSTSTYSDGSQYGDICSSPKYRVRVKNLDLKKLRMALSREIDSMSLDCLKGKSVNVCVQSFTEIVHRLGNENIKSKRSRKRKVPWWNPSLTIDRKAVQAARHLSQRCSDELKRKEYEQTYCKRQGKFRRSARWAKWALYRSILKEIDQRNPFAHTLTGYEAGLRVVWTSVR